MWTVLDHAKSLVPLMAVLLSGCLIAPAPSSTNWRKTPKVVLQVCIPTTGTHSAEIVFYRFTNLGVWTAQPVAKTEADQAIFEGTFEDPSPLHTGYGVHILDSAEAPSQKYFIFVARLLPTSSWSEWRVADTVEGKFPTELDKFKRVSRPAAEDLKSSPRIRVRTEYLYDYDRTRQSRERYANVPRCD